jgi:hypothetical protein
MSSTNQSPAVAEASTPRAWARGRGIAFAGFVPKLARVLPGCQLNGSHFASVGVFLVFWATVGRPHLARFFELWCGRCSWFSACRFVALPTTVDRALSLAPKAAPGRTALRLLVINANTLASSAIQGRASRSTKVF